VNSRASFEDLVKAKENSRVIVKQGSSSFIHHMLISIAGNYTSKSVVRSFA
jgi:hypothetical protein